MMKCVIILVANLHNFIYLLNFNSMNRLSISIVLYHTSLDMLSTCMQHYHQAIRLLPTGTQVQLYIVNNSHAQDGTVIEAWLRQWTGEIPWVYIASAKNGGYGYGHNLAIKQSQAEYHIVSNVDVYVDEQALKLACLYMDQHPHIGLLSPDVVDLKGRRYYLCKQNPSLTTALMRRSPVFLQNTLFKGTLDTFENRHLDYDQVIEDFDFPTGCWMFFRRSVLACLKGFDERYFLYCEDADIGRRLKRISHLAYVPQVKCCHAWQRASKHSWRLWLTHIRSLLRYKWKFKNG